MDFKKRRQQVFDKMENQSVLLLYSGIEAHVSADEYAPFETNRNFFYLTGLRRDNMILLMDKAASEPAVTLFIEEADPTQERWYGRKVTTEEAKEISQVDKIVFIDSFNSVIDRMMTREDVYTMYFDCYRHQMQDLPDYNLVQADKFRAMYPGVSIKNAFPLIAELRMQKDKDEVALIKEAIGITDAGLQNVLANLKPGMKEYQVQADFEYKIKYLGADSVSFPTIAGSGINGTMLHYDTNQNTCEDNTLILLDLGARYQGYCADITRTYPVNGKFTKQQREVYDVVLSANQKIVEVAKPGMTTLELNNVCKQVLAEGCIKLGLIEKEEEIGKYYMHGVSHHLGIDVHDVTVESNKKLRPGAVISNEPGLYIDEWKIGIRIEDDLLITEDGCEVLSKDIIRTADEIENYMAEQRA
ncbi:Xaa-Pro aminopeptidase [Lachnospiraceae bacterium KM106-2]|nr:Xaa-Pro aminopeptidase [Lachnospiraceae bacterium KM106-2]